MPRPLASRVHRTLPLLRGASRTPSRRFRVEVTLSVQEIAQAALIMMGPAAAAADTGRVLAEARAFLLERGSNGLFDPPAAYGAAHEDDDEDAFDALVETVVARLLEAR